MKGLRERLRTTLPRLRERLLHRNQNVNSDEDENKDEDSESILEVVPLTVTHALEQIEKEAEELAEQQEAELENEIHERFESIASRRRESSLSIEGAVKYFLEANPDEDSDYTDSDESQYEGDSDSEKDDIEGISEEDVLARIRSRRSRGLVRPSITETDRNWTKSLLLELGTSDQKTLWKMSSYLKVHEVTGLSALCKSMRMHMRGAPLRLDSLGRVVHLNDVETINSPVEFEDGKIMPKWKIAGIVSGVSDLKRLFEIVDPAEMKSVGVANRTFRNMLPITQCTGVERVEFHNCFELKNIKPLATLQKLQYLFLVCCRHLQDIEPISCLSTLKILNLYECSSIIDITPIGWLNNLRQLGLAKCVHIRDHSPLLELKNLEFLDLSESIHLVNLDVLRNCTKLHSLHLNKCVSLRDISAIEKCGQNLKVLRLNGCRKIKDISSLRTCRNLFHLRLDEMTLIKDLSPLKECKNLKDLFLSNCTKVSGLDSLRGCISTLFTLGLKGCSSLYSRDAEVLSASRKLMVLELNGASAEFLVGLLLSDVFFVRKTAKSAVISDCENKDGFDFRMKQAIQVDLLSRINWSVYKKEEDSLRDLMLETLADIVSESENAANILYEVIIARLLPFLQNPKVPTLSKRSSQVILLALTNRTKNVARKMQLVEMDIVYVFTSLIVDEVQQENEDIHVYSQEAVLSMQILGSMLGKLNEHLQVYIRRDKSATSYKYKSSLKMREAMRKLVIRMQGLNSLIEDSGVILDLLAVIDQDYPDTFAKGASYSLLLNFVTNASNANKISQELQQGKSTLTLNDHENLTTTLPPVLVSKAVLLILNSLDVIPVNVKMIAAGLIVLLVRNGGDKARNVVITKPGIVSFIKDLMVSGNPNSFSSLNSSSIDIEQLEMSGSFIKVASELIQVIPSELYPKLMQAEVVHSMIAPLEHSAGKILEQHDDTEPYVEGKNPIMTTYIQNIVSMTRALYTIAADPPTCKKIGDTIPKAVPVIPLVLHSAVQEHAYADSAKLLLRLLDGSEIYRAKVQLVYSNSDITVALGVFTGDPVDKEKLYGLRILDILMESNVFIEKLIDCEKDKLDQLYEEFSDFVFKDNFGRPEVLKVASRLIGKGIKGDSEDYTLLKQFVIPEIATLKHMCETPKTELAKEFAEESNSKDSFDGKMFNDLLKLKPNGDSDDEESKLSHDESSVDMKLATRILTHVLFLEGLIGENKAVAAIGAIDPWVLTLLYKYILESEPESKATHEAILRLFATMVEVYENINTPIYQPIEEGDAIQSQLGSVEQHDSIEENEEGEHENENKVTHALLSGNPTTALIAQEMKRQMEDRQRDLESAEVQRLLDRNRKQKLLEKLSSDLKRLDGSGEDSGENPSKTEFEILSRMKLEMIWQILCGNETKLRETMDICVDTLSSNITKHGSTGALDLIIAFCEHEKDYPQRLLTDREDIMEHLRTFLMLDEDTRAGACRLVVFLGSKNPDIICDSVLEPLSSNLLDHDQRNLMIKTVETFLTLLRFDGANELLRRTSIGENLAICLESFQSGELESLGDFSECIFIASVLGGIVASDPAVLTKLLQNPSGSLGDVIVQILLANFKGDIRKTLLSRVTCDTIENVLSSNNETELRLLAEVLVYDHNFLEVLKKWSVADEQDYQDFQEIRLLADIEIMSLNLILRLSDTSVLSEVDLENVILPQLIKTLMDNPSQKFAALIMRLNSRAFQNEDFDMILDRFLEYDIFKESIQAEKETIARQKDDGDVVFNRIRGLPQEASCSRKYEIIFGDTLTTAAVKSEKVLCHPLTKLYFEVEILHTKGELSIGWISSDFEEGVLAGELKYGIGDDTESWAWRSRGDLGVNVILSRPWKANDVVGVLADTEKGCIRFSLNGRFDPGAVFEVEDTTVIQTLLPAISGKRAECQFNLGSTPFKFSPDPSFGSVEPILNSLL